MLITFIVLWLVGVWPAYLVISDDPDPMHIAARIFLAIFWPIVFYVAMLAIAAGAVWYKLRHRGTKQNGGLL